jgi:branched-chain amino acid transport system ATP-binding protein
MALLAVKDLTHCFGGLCAVRDFNLTLVEGEIAALIGPNGAGKTTVFNIVCGFYRPTKGAISFSGANIAGMRPHRISAMGIARTFQNIRLWNNATVFDNLCISQHHRLNYGFWGAILNSGNYRENERRVRKKAENLVELLDLGRYSAEFPGKLPYGVQRRVEIARALATEPKLLLLDEPAAGMNPGEIKSLIDIIGWIHEEFKLTIWMIEHHMKVVMDVCRQIKVLDFGEAIAEGTPGEVRANPRVIQAYLGNPEEDPAPEENPAEDFPSA